MLGTPSGNTFEATVHVQAYFVVPTRLSILTLINIAAGSVMQQLVTIWTGAFVVFFYNAFAWQVMDAFAAVIVIVVVLET